MTSEPVSRKAKKQQYVLFICLIVLLLLGCFLLNAWLTQARTKPHQKLPIKNHSVSSTVDTFSTTVSETETEGIWQAELQQKIKKSTEKQAALATQLALLNTQNTAHDQQLSEQVQAFQQLSKRMHALETEKEERAVGQKTAAPFLNEDHLLLQKNEMVAASAEKQNFIPAGTIVQGILLGGADASAGVTSQTNPTPLLLRFLDDGQLPNHVKSHLKDCVATAAVVGDISSERGQIRLERLSCVRSQGVVREVPVEATVFGPDGRNGVRGLPVWREGALLQRAFVAGTLSGVSEGIAQSYTTSAISPLGSESTIDNGKIAQYGVANGVGNAASALAEYNIKRAEQYHPVIQLSAGTVVDVVFLKGFYLDDASSRGGV